MKILKRTTVLLNSFQIRTFNDKCDPTKIVTSTVHTDVTTYCLWEGVGLWNIVDYK